MLRAQNIRGLRKRLVKRKRSRVALRQMRRLRLKISPSNDDEPRRQFTDRYCHSMTSSACSKIDGGIARPSAVAVLRFTTISVPGDRPAFRRCGCSPAPLPGFAPLPGCWLVFRICFSETGLTAPWGRLLWGTLQRSSFEARLGQLGRPIRVRPGTA